MKAHETTRSARWLYIVIAIVALIVIAGAVVVFIPKVAAPLMTLASPAPLQDQARTCTEDGFYTRCQAVVNGCVVLAVQNRGTFDIGVILQGKRRGQILVDVRRMASINPAPVLSQLQKTFSDTQEPYIYQIYSPVELEPGGYELIIGINGVKKASSGWIFADAYEHLVYVDCDTAG